MRKAVTISIAILLGLVNAQVAMPGVDPKMQEALKSIVQVPTFAKSAIVMPEGIPMTGAMAMPEGIPMTGAMVMPETIPMSGAMVMPEGLPMYGAASMNQFTSVFSPEKYLGVVTGDTNSTVASTIKNPQMALQKKWMDSQVAIAKSQMMLFFTEEMVTLQTELQSTATKLTACNWTCVSDCAAPKPDLVGRANCLESCGCYSNAKFNLTAAAAIVPTPASTAAPLAMFAVDPAYAKYIPAGTPNVTVDMANYVPAGTPIAAPATPIAMFAVDPAWAKYIPADTPNATFPTNTTGATYTSANTPNATLPDTTAAATPLVLASWTQQEMARDQIEADFEAQENALNQAQLLAEQVLNLQLQADLAALQQAQLVVAAQAAAALAAANSGITPAINSVVNKVITPAVPLVLLAHVELNPAVPTLPVVPITPAPITAATLTADYTAKLAALRATFTKEKQIARIAIKESEVDLDLQFQIQQLNEQMTLQNTVVATMAPESKAIFNQLQAKQMEVLLKQQTMNKVNSAVLRVKTNTATQITEFQTILDGTVAQLKCDAVCVNSCATAALTIDTKVLCLTTCNCYATTTIVVAPSAAVAATVAAMTTPVVMTPAAPVVVTPAPVVAQPVIQAPVAEVITTPATAAVVAPEGATAQVLFLGEEAVVAAASGTISGLLIISSAFIFIALMGVAFLQSKKLLQRKPFLWFNNKNERESSLDEYLLIKA